VNQGLTFWNLIRVHTVHPPVLIRIPGLVEYQFPVAIQSSEPFQNEASGKKFDFCLTEKNIDKCVEM